jgi:hypothetical protein
VTSVEVICCLMQTQNRAAARIFSLAFGLTAVMSALWKL